MDNCILDIPESMVHGPFHLSFLNRWLILHSLLNFRGILKGQNTSHKPSPPLGREIARKYDWGHCRIAKIAYNDHWYRISHHCLILTWWQAKEFSLLGKQWGMPPGPNYYSKHVGVSHCAHISSKITIPCKARRACHIFLVEETEAQGKLVCPLSHS